ncbi:hypothetical protein D3C76_985840 [compost metagenome]
MAFAVQQGDHQRPLFVGGVQAADQVSALVAVQHRREQLDCQCRVLAHPVRQAFAQLFFQARQVAFQVTIGHIERVVGEDRPQQAFETIAKCVGAGLRGALVAAHRRPGGVDEHAAVADLVMAEQAAEQRVVPGLGQLIVEPWVDQANVGALDQRPLLHLQQYILGEALA